MDKKEKAAKINQRSKKWQVGLYRVTLKFTFIALIYTVYSVIVSEKLRLGVAEFSEFSFSAVPALLGAFLYQIIYYYYKLNTESKVFGREPEGATFLIFVKLVSYCAGASLCFIGAYFYNKNQFLPWLLLILPGTFLVELLYNNRNLSSHVSTFTENLSAGLTVVAIAMIAKGNIKASVIVFAVTVPLLLIKNFAYHVFNSAKHCVKYVETSLPELRESGENDSVSPEKRKSVLENKRNLIKKTVLSKPWISYIIFDDRAVFKACEKNFSQNAYALEGALKILEDRIKNDIIGKKRVRKCLSGAVGCIVKADKKAGGLTGTEEITSLLLKIIKEAEENYFVSLEKEKAALDGIMNLERTVKSEGDEYSAFADRMIEKIKLPEKEKMKSVLPDFAFSIIESIDLGRLVFLKDVMTEMLILFVWFALWRAGIFTGVINSVFTTAKDWLPLAFTFITTGIAVFNFAKPKEKK